MRTVLYATLIYTMACGNENIIEKQANVAPTITIQSHSDGAEILEGYVESFRVQVSDDDNEFDELEVGWFVGEEEVCPWEVASAAGESFCDIVFSSEDTAVVAEVRDTQGAGGRDELSITVLETEAPVVEILFPMQSGNYYADQLIQFAALLSDAEDSPEELISTWTSNIVGELSLDNTPDTSGEISDFAYLSEGEHAIQLLVEDSTGKNTVEEVVIIVRGDNNEPLCEITEPPSGSSTFFGQNISFSGTATDVDINNSLLSIVWESNQDGIFDSTAANSAGEMTVVYNGLSVGNHIITLRVEDEVGGLCTDTTNIAVGTAPTLTLTAPLSGDVVSVGESVSFAATVNDSEDLPSDITMSWTSDVAGEFSTQGPDSGGNIYFAESALTAGLHTITVTATDSTQLMASTSINIRINTPPTAPTVVLSPDPITSADTLTVMVSSSADVDGDVVTHSYSWYEDSVLTSFTSAAIAASELDVGETWMVRVTPNDGYVDGSFTEESITVSNLGPTVTSVSISPNTFVYNDSVLNCTATATDPDEIVIPTVEWTVAMVTYTGASLDLSTTLAMPTDVVTCTATAMDSGGASHTLSTAVTVDNRLPSIVTLSISPNTNVYNDSTVLCLGTATDPEEVVTPTYEWRVGSILVGTTNTLDLVTTAALPGDVLECTVSVTDSNGGTDSAMTSLVIDNRPPSSGVVVLSPNAPEQGIDDLTCSATASDVDGQNLSYTYEWSSDAGSVVGASVVSASATTSGEIWTCTVVISDVLSSIILQDSVTIVGGCADPFDTNCDSIVDGRILATGSVTSCAINNAGQIECWGDNSSNQLLTIPQGVYVSLSFSGQHGCALDAAGNVACWGLNNHGQSNPPSLTFGQIATGAYHTCGLDSSGGVHCWGAGQSSGNWPEYGQSNPPAGTFTQISADYYHTCGVQTNGTIACWGITNGDVSRDYGQVTDTPMTGGFVQVDTGLSHNCALDTVGMTTCWGRNEAGQSTPPITSFVQVSSGWMHSCGLQSTGSVQCWGIIDNGNYDFGQVTDTPSATFVQISIGSYNSCGIDDTGMVHCWGWDIWGQSTPPNGFVAYPF